MESMTEATDAFVKGADWLTDDDQAAVAALYYAADALDNATRPNGAMLAQWYRIYGQLRTRKVEEPTQTTDEGDEFLARHGI
jgi:hypothetical protein